MRNCITRIVMYLFFIPNHIRKNNSETKMFWVLHLVSGDKFLRRGSYIEIINESKIEKNKTEPGINTGPQIGTQLLYHSSYPVDPCWSWCRPYNLPFSFFYDLVKKEVMCKVHTIRLTYKLCIWYLLINVGQHSCDECRYRAFVWKNCGWISNQMLWDK